MDPQSTKRSPGFRDVIVVGAGPSGLLLALLLSQAGIPVRLVEMSEGLDQNPRATHYGGPAIAELDRAGVGDEVRRRGFAPEGGLHWRRLDGSVIGVLPLGAPRGGTSDELVCLPLDRLGALLLERIRAQGSQVEILFHHRVVGLGQDGAGAWVDVEAPEGSKRLEASYVVGCDGGNSQVRRCLLGEREFPGWTWDEQLVATNTRYDFEKYGWGDSNFIVDPEHWFLAAKITRDGMWRVTYGDRPGLANDELLQRQPWKFKKMLPGHPDPDQYEVVRISPYRVHQRLAKSMRVGRFLLAADAAHLCNPFGGLGLTGGIVDVGNLFDCLRGIYENKADDSILDKYNEVRRKIYTEVTDPISTGNMRRLCSLDPDRAADEDPFFIACAKAQADPEFARHMVRSIYDLQHDFTQYYRDEDVTNESIVGPDSSYTAEIH